MSCYDIFPSNFKVAIWLGTSVPFNHNLMFCSQILEKNYETNRIPSNVPKEILKEIKSEVLTKKLDQI